jgi:protein KTI12
MPYIILLTGHPCSGKTTLAHQIRERALSSSAHAKLLEKVVIVPDSEAPTTAYATSAAEKVLRAALKSAFDRAVATAVHDETATSHIKKTKKTLIILDSTNYIKGFRYELFCIGKAATSRYCVVWCLNDIHIVKEWNLQRRRENKTSSYPDEVLEALLLRYEPPDERNRWDRPLFRIDVRPPHLRMQQAEIAGNLLHHSLYNMHNLSAALSRPLPANHEETSTMAPSQDAATSAAKGSTTFKRSAFQKKKSMTNTVNTSVPVALTAEALSTFQAATSNQELSLASAPMAPPANERNRRAVTATVAARDDVALLVEEQIDVFLRQFLGGDVAALTASTSTRAHTSVEADVLHVVDSITHQLCTSILEALADQSSALVPDKLLVSFQGQPYSLHCALNQRSSLTAGELRRIRQEYLQWMGKYPSQELEGGSGRDRSIVESFLTYIATHTRR